MGDMYNADVAEQYLFKQRLQCIGAGSNKNATVVNEDNQYYYDTEGGGNTVDKVYLLSISEAMNPSYGFTSTESGTATRKAVDTAYVAAGSSGMSSAGSAGSWWLRSSRNHSDVAAYVYYTGFVDRIGDIVNHNNAVRPALHLNLSSTSEWSYAGTVSSYGGENEIPAPNPPVTPSSNPSLIPGGESSAPPSVLDKPSSSSNPSTGQSTTTVILPTSVPRVSEETSQPQISTKVQTPAKVTALRLKAKKKAIEASWKKVSEATGYEIQVSTSKEFTKKSTKTTKKTKLTIGKLKSKTKYFVRVRAYHVANGKKTYGKWSNIMNIKTKK